jgi:hypothetical protein
MNNMTNFGDILKKDTNNPLTSEEKEKSLGVLRAFMLEHPLTLSSVSVVSRFSFFKTNRYLLVPAVLVLAVLTSGGVSLAAQKALPGDPLYLFKVQVNDKVVSAFTVGIKPSLDVQAEQATTRLEEAEQLATKGDFSSADQSQVAVSFNEHTAAVTSLIDKLKTSGDATTAAQVSVSFKKTLISHQAFLIKLAGTDGHDRNSLLNLAQLVGDAASSTPSGTGTSTPAASATSTVSTTATSTLNGSNDATSTLIDGTTTVPLVTATTSDEADIEGSVHL